MYATTIRGIAVGHEILITAAYRVLSTHGPPTRIMVANIWNGPKVEIVLILERPRRDAISSP